MTTTGSELLDMQRFVGRGEAAFAASKPADFDVGVNYRGSWETEWAGVQSSVRRHARALSTTGMPVWLVSHGHTMEYLDENGEIVSGFADHTKLAESVESEVGHLLSCRHKQPLLAIEHRVFSPEAVLNIVYPARTGRIDPLFRRRVNATTILYTVFERAAPDDDVSRVVAAMGNLAEVWVPCERNRRVLIECGMDANRVVRMPHPTRPDDPVWHMRASRRGRLDAFVVSHCHAFRPKKLRFVNVGKWEPRKAQHEMLGGFLLAFRPGEHELVLKHNAFGQDWEGYPKSPQQSIHMWLQNSSVINNGWTSQNVSTSIKVFGQTLPREALVRFLAESDVYVSAGRSEGFDMPALDAKILGLRLVVMGYGGAEDFATCSDVMGKSPLCSTHPGYGWKGATWSGHTPEDVASALKLAAEMEGDPDRPRVDIDTTQYTEAAVGQKMLERCLGIIARITPEFKFVPVKEYQDA
jgi:glycosyltransferase involved in cell wall biosynthesis